MDNNFHTRKQLLKWLNDMVYSAQKQSYWLWASDIFALWYVFWKYDVKDWSESEIRKATVEYDKTDDLAIADTIEETLVDLWILKDFSK